MNRNFRVAIVEVFGTQIRASRKLKIRESRLSYLINGHVDPSEKEVEIIEAAFGRKRLCRIFPSRAGTRRRRRDCHYNEVMPEKHKDG